MSSEDRTCNELPDAFRIGTTLSVLLVQQTPPSLLCRHARIARTHVGLFAAAEEAALEGIVAKKSSAPYRRGKTGDWIKVKTTAGKALVGDRGEWNKR